MIKIKRSIINELRLNLFYNSPRKSRRLHSEVRRYLQRKMPVMIVVLVVWHSIWLSRERRIVYGHIANGSCVAMFSTGLGHFIGSVFKNKDISIR